MPEAARVVPNPKLARSLLVLRLSISLVMMMWALDKLIDPRETTGIYAHFYGLKGVGGGAIRIIGLAELALLGAFVVGLWKRWTYGAVLILHAASTFSSYGQYVTPWKGGHLLFFAAWPMLAACYALYVCRDEDVLLTFWRGSPRSIPP